MVITPQNQVCQNINNVSTFALEFKTKYNVYIKDTVASRLETAGFGGIESCGRRDTYCRIEPC